MMSKKKDRHDAEKAEETAAAEEPIRMMPLEEEVFDDSESKPEEIVTGNAVAVDLDALLAERDALKKENDELKNEMLRHRAELENFRKRMHREMDRVRAIAAERLVMDLLPVLDHLHLAVDHAGNGAAGMEEGVRMVAKQFSDVLGRHGVTPIASEGEPFDPNRHEAVMQEPSASVPAMTVLREFQRGYEMGGKVLRAPKVVVSTGSGSEPAVGETETSSEE